MPASSEAGPGAASGARVGRWSTAGDWWTRVGCVGKSVKVHGGGARPEARHLDGAQDGVEGDDSGGVGAEARKERGEEEDAQEEAEVAQDL